MKHISKLIATFIATCTILATSHAENQTVPGRIIVKWKTNSQTAQQVKSFSKHGAKERRKNTKLNTSVLQVAPNTEIKTINELKKDPNVEYVEPDYVAQALLTPNDPYFPVYQWHHSKISTPKAWDKTTGNSSITIAVIDTGVDPTNEDLVGRVTNGYDFVENDSNPFDDNGHGTQVATIAAGAGNNLRGGAGVAWKSTIIPIKVLDYDGYGSYSSIADGIIYAADRGAKIINLSLGGPDNSALIQDAVNYAWNKGCLIIAAAGNEGINEPLYPASCENVISVSALTDTDNLAYWSSYGANVDISAPGDNLFTSASGNQVVSVSGTSFSSPLVAGVAALALSVNSSLTPSQLASCLFSNVDDLGIRGKDIYYGHGKVNAEKVITALTTSVQPPPVNDIIKPTTAIITPVHRTTLRPRTNIVVVQATSSDNIAISKVELYVNNVLTFVSTSKNFRYVWPAVRFPKGTYVFQTKAYDTSGNIGVSPYIFINK